MPNGQATSPGKKLVLVCGAARSGTTMLDLMLGNAENAFSSGEIYALFRPFRSHHFAPVCSCGKTDCPVWRDLRTLPAHEFHHSVLGRPGIDFVIDSSKDLRWVLDSNVWASGHGFGVQNVVIWKEPVDLAYSHWKRGRPVDYFRKQFLDYYERFLALDLPFVSVSYKDLVERPDELLPLLCEQIGMDYFPGKQDFWRKSHHHFFGSAGAARQVESGSSRVGLNREFPEEFRKAWEDYRRAMGPDKRLARVEERLRARDVLQAKGGAAGKMQVHVFKPLWYYWHAVKAFFRRYFPERTAVAD